MSSADRENTRKSPLTSLVLIVATLVVGAETPPVAKVENAIRCNELGWRRTRGSFNAPRPLVPSERSSSRECMRTHLGKRQTRKCRCEDLRRRFPHRCQVVAKPHA